MKYVIPFLFKNFTCIQSGDCCRGWNVEASPEKFQEILLNLQKISEEQRPKNSGFEINKNEEGEIESVYTKHIEGRCCFLVEDKCFLHQHFGSKGKPQICQSYPYYVIMTPSVTYVNLSVACACSLRLLNSNLAYKAVRPSCGGEVPIKVDFGEEKFVYLSEKKRILWKSFYHLHQNLINRKFDINYIDGLWHALQSCPQEKAFHAYVKKIKFSAIRKKSKPAPTEHLLMLIELLKTWNYQEEILAGSINFFFNLLKIDIEKIDHETAMRYQEFYAKHFPSQEELIIDNYLYKIIFANEFYFRENILTTFTLAGLIRSLVCFFVLVGLGNSEEPVNDSQILNSIFVVEKFFFHSEVFDEFCIENRCHKHLQIAPAIAASPL